MSFANNNKLPSRLILSIAVASAMLANLANQQVYAGSCTGAGGVYSCSGTASTDTTQNLTGSPIQATTESGFGIITTIGDALNLIGTHGVSFVDDYVSAITAKNDAINAHNSATGGIEISTSGTLDADNDAISVLNLGTGAVSITTTGVINAGDDGIQAENQIAGTDLTITTTAAITGADEAIVAENYGTGALTVNASGTLIGNGDEGLQARNYHGTDLTVNTAIVTGDDTGIWAENLGTGKLSLTATGAVTGTRFDGINVENHGTDLTVIATTVTGKDDGIEADNQGSGALSITATGTVTGIDDYGITAINSVNGTNLIINTAAINAQDHGINADNDGTGAINITSTGTITSADVGIFANNSAAGTDLTINSAAITGADEGIGADNYGSGALTITATGAIVGNSDEGIDAENNGTDLTIITTTVTGNDDGIAAVNYGSGALSISATGTVTGGDDAIYVENMGTDSTLVTAAVSGGDDGITITHDGSGQLNITTNGLVEGGTGSALRLDRDTAGNFAGTINNNAGWSSTNASAVNMISGFNFTGTINTAADISGGNGTAIDASATTTDFTINQTAGNITGDILLGAGDTVLNITGGTLNGDIIGQGKGTVNANAGTGNTLTFYGITNVQDFNILSGTVNQLGDFSTAGTTTTIAQGATLLFSSVINGTGALVSNGNLAFTPGAQLNQTGTVTLGTGSTITANLQGTVATLNQQQQYISATSLVNNGASFESNSLLYDAQGTFVGNTLRLESVVADLENISSQSNPSAFGAAMKTYIEGGANNDVVSALAALFAGDVSGFEHVANTFSPSVSGMIIHGSRLLYNENWRAISKRLLTPQADSNQGVWVQALGSKVNHGKVDDIDGFNSDSTGLSVGFDQQFGAWQAGISLSHGEVSSNNKRSANDDSDISSSQLTLYSSFDAENWFAQFNVSAAMLDYKFERNSSISSEGRITGKSKGNLLGLDFSVGLNEMHFSDISFKPIASLRYSHLSIDDYTENGGLNLQVSYENTETLTSEIGLHAQLNNFARGAWQITPVANLSWSHEFIGDTEQAVASFAGQSFTQSGASQQKNNLHLGFGLMAERTNGLSVGLQFSSTLSSDTFQPSAVFNMQYAF